MNLLRQIESSFPKLAPESTGFLSDAVTEVELDTLAADISSFYIEDVPPFLGALLYASAKNPPRDPWKWERLIYYLNAATEGAQIAGSDMGRDEADIAAERKLRIERQGDFERLAPDQIAAVRDWLAAAQSWSAAPSLMREIQGALHYWSALAERSQRRH
jgi:hypothetical protein